ncbi:MAG TPA: lysylphosphatidylglycerol synthase transmembrane domain-containing protein [Bryobacteraceae bacterium]|nr:lysylphosphatidylglycerol synthase transmembrane domain-containing protein [Bryobacteraceae bacterium]
MLDSAKAADSRAWKGKAILVVAGLLVVALLFYRLRGSSFQWQLFLGTLYHVNWIWLTISMALMLLTYWGRALRWQVMLRPLGRTLSVRKLTYDTAIGFTAVVLLGRAGEVVRPYLISLSARVPFSSQVAAWMLERILDLLAVLLLFGFALLWIPSRGLALGPALRWILGAGGYLVAGIGIACLLFLILFRNFSEAGQRRLLSAVSFLPENYYKRVEQMLGAFSQGMESTRDAKSLVLLLCYTALEWALIVGCYYALFLSFPSTGFFKITDVVITLGFLAFGSIVQLPGIGGGVQVVSVLVLTEIYHLPIEAASAVAVFIWSITFVVVVPVGFVCAFHEGLNWSKLRQLPKDVSL